MKIIKNWLKKLAEENEKSFGKEKMDCCKLNSDTNKNTVKNINNNKKNNY